MGEIEDIDELFVGYDDEHPFCSSDLRRAYGAIFAILIGQFDLALFMEKDYLFYVSMTFAFLMVIFLLSMIIAVIGEEYEKVKVKAQDEFYKLRIDFAAEQVMIGNSILRSTFKEMVLKEKIVCCYHWLVQFTVFMIYVFMCYENFENVRKTVNSESFVYYGLYGGYLAMIVFVLIQMITLGFSQLLLVDTIIKHHAREDGILLKVRSFILTPFTVIDTDNLINLIGNSDENDDFGGRMVIFERSTGAIVKESEKRICKVIKATEEEILAHEKEMKYCIAEMIENVCSNKKDDSSCSSDGSSHITFTREDLNLPLPC